jgi:phosphotransacetylase
MAKSIKDSALKCHSEGKPDKIEVVPTKPHTTQRDLSLAYSPGVAVPCLEIEKTAYDYTAKGNLVAVISNGTAVLGLGDIGALAGKPVMEWKGLLFKILAGIDVFDIEINEKDPQKFVEAMKAIAPTFGDINLEDIKAPECFEIETRLKGELDIPVMHDDQHDTAIISTVGLINALELTDKRIEDVRIVVNGTGTSACSCTKLYIALGVRKEHIVMCDSEGIEIVNLQHDREEERRNRYAEILCRKRAREGTTCDELRDKMFERNYFGMMMVETGDVDAFITGVYTKYSNTIKVAREVIGIRESYQYFVTMHIMTGKKGTFFLADTLTNRHPSAETLIDMVRLTHHAVSSFAHDPVMAMFSYSRFGTDTKGSPVRVYEVIRYLHENDPDIVIDGETQTNFAPDRKMRDAKYPFSKLNRKGVNTLISPNLNSAHIARKLMQEKGGAKMIDPIQTGLNKPIHFTDIENSVRDIIHITTVAVLMLSYRNKSKNNNRLWKSVSHIG